MKARYSVPITRKFATDFMRAYFGSVRLPTGAKFIWVAGVHYVTDQPGVYLISAAGGSCGIVVLAPAVEQTGEVSA